MKKLITILFMAFLLTGCSVNYKLEFNEDNLKESIDVKYSNMSETQKNLYNSKELYAVNNQSGDAEPLDIANPLYNINRTKDMLHLDYTYDYNLFMSSYILTTCFPEESYIYNNNAVFISINEISDECYTGPMTITFKTDKFVDEQNADEVNGNEYTWNIDDKDQIDIKFSAILDKKEEKATLGTYLYKIAVIVGLMLIILGLVHIYKKIQEHEVGD